MSGGWKGVTRQEINFQGPLVWLLLWTMALCLHPAYPLFKKKTFWHIADDIMLASQCFADLETHLRDTRHGVHLREQGWETEFTEAQRPGTAVAFLGTLLLGQGTNASH